MLKIGLTGGIGSGKSYIASVFRALDVPVYEADREARRLMQQDQELSMKVRQLLGAEAYLENRLNTAYVAGIVFNDSNKLKALNALVHPAVHRDFAEWAGHQENTEYVIEEAALIFESGGDRQLDYTIFVRASMDKRIKRVIRRDSATREDVEARIRNQLPEDLKEDRADFIIDNEEDTLVLPRVIELDKMFKEKYRNKDG